MRPESQLDQVDKIVPTNSKIRFAATFAARIETISDLAHSGWLRSTQHFHQRPVADRV